MLLPPPYMWFPGVVCSKVAVNDFTINATKLPFKLPWNASFALHQFSCDTIQIIFLRKTLISFRIFIPFSGKYDKEVLSVNLLRTAEIQILYVTAQ